MDVPDGTWHAPTNQSRDTFASTNSSQHPSLHTLPLPPSQCGLLCTEIKSCSWMNYSSPTMPATDSCTLVLLVPCLDQFRRQVSQICQLTHQHIGSNPEHLSHDISKPQTVYNTWVPEAASEATLPKDLLILADSDFLPPRFSDPTIIEPQTQSGMSSLATHYPAQYSPSPKEPHELQSFTHQQIQRHACSQPNCSTTFKRVHELKRHIATIHGRKKRCPYTPCGYKTGRKDKMVEHARKMHGGPGA